MEQGASFYAKEALQKAGIAAHRLTLLKAQPNTIFRVHVEKGADLVLRLRNEPIDLAVLKLQSRWLQALRDHGLNAPSIVPLQDKLSVTIGRRQATLYTWIGGRRAMDA